MSLYRNEIVAKYLAMPLCEELEKRAMVGWDYWLNASPHEWTEEDARIVAHYARLAFEEITKLRKKLKALDLKAKYGPAEPIVAPKDGWSDFEQRFIKPE